jgi:hypothetical protein
MDIRQAGVLAVAIPVALLVASVVTWAACRWWYGRKLGAAEQRLQKIEKGRLFSQQQTAQKRRAAQLEEALSAVERAPAEDVAMMPVVSAHGFADTQILPD